MSLNTTRYQKSQPLSMLRGHLHSVTCSQYIYVPQNITSTTRLKPTLITSDTKGWIIWWDLFTRRPIAVWKGHDDNVVSIKQMGLTWSTMDGESEPVIDDKVFGLVITHSKDYEIKVWDLFKNENGGMELSTLMLSTELPSSKYLDSSLSETIKQYPHPKSESIAVNTLNFCNIDNYDDLLLTANTTDSNNFDIYRIFKSRYEHSRQDILSYLDLSRISTNIDPWELYQKQLKSEAEFEIGNTDDITKRDKFGIMMRVIFIDENLFFIGYESGHLLGFKFVHNQSQDNIKTSNKPIQRAGPGSGLSKLFSESRSEKPKGNISRTVINKDPSISLISVNKDHFPNPILSICYDEKRKILLTGSTGKKIIFHDINQHITASENKIMEYRTTAQNLKHSGISSLSTRDDGLVSIAFWDGYARIYQYTSGCEITEIDKITRVIPKIGIDDPNPQSDKKDISKKKLNYLAFSRLQNGGVNGKLRRRDADNFSKKYLVLAYDDGKVGVYDYQA